MHASSNFVIVIWSEREIATPNNDPTVVVNYSIKWITATDYATLGFKKIEKEESIVFLAKKSLSQATPPI